MFKKLILVITILTTAVSITSAQFKVAPQGFVEVLERSTGIVGGVKLTAGTNTTYVYYLFNPSDSGESISEATISIDPNFVTVLGTSVTVEVIGEGAGSAPNPGAIAAGIPKYIAVTFSTPLTPGSLAIIKINSLTAPSAAGGGTYVWKCIAKGLSGEFAQCEDMDGFADGNPAGQVINISGTAVMDKFYSGVYVSSTPPIFTKLYPKAISEYRVLLFKTSAFDPQCSPIIIDLPSGFNCTNATLSIQENGLTGSSVSFSNRAEGIIKVVFTNGVENNSPIITISGVTNPSVPGTFIWKVYYSNVINADALAVGQPAYKLTTTIIQEPGTQAGVTNISSSGGTAYSADRNASLTIPSSGISGFAQVSITPVDTDLVPSSIGQPYLIPIGTTYDFTVDKPLLKKATVSIKYNESEVENKVVDSLVLGYYDDEKKEWRVGEDCKVDKISKTVSAKVYHLSYWRIFEYQPSDGSLLTEANIYPNPFRKDNSSVNIKFTINKPATVKIEIFDFGGKLIKEIINEARSEGVQTVNWDGKDSGGDNVSNGVYLVKVTAIAGSTKDESIKKIVILK